MSDCREVHRDMSISFSVMSGTGYPCVGKVVIVSMPVKKDVVCGGCAACASIPGSWRGLWGDSLRGLDLTGLRVDGEEFPEDPSLPVERTCC